MNLFDNFVNGLSEDDTKVSKPDIDMCSCSTCFWEGKVDECDGFRESECWEMPQQYYVHLCPVCEDDGCIDNYWPSKEEID